MSWTNGYQSEVVTDVAMTIIHGLAPKNPTLIHNSDQWIDVLKISTQSRIQELGKLQSKAH